MLAALANARGLATPGVIIRPQDVFATSLYTGTGAGQTITSGFAPDLVWQKARSTSQSNTFVDRIRGGSAFLVSDTTAAEATTSALSFGNSGFSTNTNFQGTSGQTYAAWSFRRAPKFFDIVTYTGDGTSGRVIPHALGIKPGMIVVKRRDGTGNWTVYHVALNAQNALVLNSTASTVNDFGNFRNTEPTASDFTLGNNAPVNAAGGLYVAYLFAHDPDTTNGIVQCGSFTTAANGIQDVRLGWRPQWIMFKGSATADNWCIFDSARGMTDTVYKELRPNTADAEVSSPKIAADNTGFVATNLDTSKPYIYVVIRAPI